MIWNEKYLNPQSCNIGEPSPSILYITENDKLGTLKDGKIKDLNDWKWYVDKYQIKYWIRQKNIIDHIQLELYHY